MLPTGRNTVARTTRSTRSRAPPVGNANDDYAAADDTEAAEDDCIPKSLHDPRVYDYQHVPFGFPPWFLEKGAQSTAELWQKLAVRYQTMVTRMDNLKRVFNHVNYVSPPASYADLDKQALLCKKLADAADALKAYADFRRSSPISITDKPLQLLTCAEDALWMVLTCLCGLLKVDVPRIHYRHDKLWEWRLGKITENLGR